MEMPEVHKLDDYRVISFVVTKDDSDVAYSSLKTRLKRRRKKRGKRNRPKSKQCRIGHGNFDNQRKVSKEEYKYARRIHEKAVARHFTETAICDSLTPGSISLPNDLMYGPTNFDPVKLSIRVSPFKIWEDICSGITYQVLVDGSRYSFFGEGQLRIFHGCLVALGSVLKTSTTWHPVSSSVKTNLLTVDAVGESFTEATGLHREVLNIVHSYGLDKVTVVGWRAATGLTLMDFVGSTGSSYGLFSVDCTGLPVKLGSSGMQSVTVEHVVEYSTEVQQAIDEIVAHECPKLIICGSKDVGKSTLGRFCANQLLQRWEQVAFLDCDVGQSEFTPMGCVSLTLVSRPILCGPSSHLQQPDKCVFYGCNTPMDDPLRYINCVKVTWQYYKENAAHLPLVINTMGWTKGLGVLLLVDQIRITQPHFIVQLQSGQWMKNLPLTLTCKSLQQMAGFSMMQESPPCHVLFNIESPNTVMHYNSKSVKAFHERAVTLLAYFRALGVPLWSSTPYCLPWANVGVHVSHMTVPNSHILYALNGSLVGLCRVEPELLLDSGVPGCPKFIAETPVADLLGFGIIRGIDPDTQTFLIVTPLSEVQLAPVNLLMKGSFDLPNPAIKNQISKGQFYIDEVLKTHGSHQTQKRRKIGRRYKTHVS